MAGHLGSQRVERLPARLCRCRKAQIDSGSRSDRLFGRPLPSRCFWFVRLSSPDTRSWRLHCWQFCRMPELPRELIVRKELEVRWCIWKSFVLSGCHRFYSSQLPKVLGSAMELWLSSDVRADQVGHGRVCSGRLSKRCEFPWCPFRGIMWFSGMEEDNWDKDIVCLIPRRNWRLIRREEWTRNWGWSRDKAQLMPFSAEGQTPSLIALTLQIERIVLVILETLSIKPIMFVSSSLSMLHWRSVDT